MIRASRSFYIISVFTLLVLSALPAVGITSSSPLEQKTRFFELPNGLKVIILERHQSPTVALYVTYRVGGVDEEEGKTGTAHLLEHMMFKGTPTIGTKNFAREKVVLARIIKTEKLLEREKDADKAEKLRNRLKSLKKEQQKWVRSNEIDRLYTEAGGVNINASTSIDLTEYHVSLPANKLELWARIEADRMANIVMREFFEERQVVLEERRQRKEANPQGALYEEFISLAFTRHPYRRPVIGWETDISRLQPEDLARFKRNFYAPNNATVAIVGDVKTEDALKIVKRYFASIPGRKVARPDIPPEPPFLGTRRVSLSIKANRRLMIGYHKPPPPQPDNYVFDVIETILSRGRAGRLYKKLVDERGIAESVGAQNGLPGDRYPNLFVISGTPRGGYDNRVLEEAISEILEELKEKDVPVEELTAVKNNMKADFIRLQETNEGIAQMLVYYQSLLGDYRYAFTYLDEISKVTPTDIRRVAEKYLKKSARILATID